jgi:hypothetical protein
MMLEVNRFTKNIPTEIGGEIGLRRWLTGMDASP